VHPLEVAPFVMVTGAAFFERAALVRRERTEQEPPKDAHADCSLVFFTASFEGLSSSTNWSLNEYHFTALFH
jgi:hypothetical protein